MLILAPHPDDETLAVGGLIASQRLKGVDVVIAAVTDGENCYPDIDGLGPIRRLEQEKALKHLGVDEREVVRFQLPDSSVSEREQELIARLMPLTSTNRKIVAPWPGDFHPDHEACGRAAIEVSSRVGSPLIFYFFWTWHRGTTDLIRALPLCSFELNKDLQQVKRDALLEHRSQFASDSGEPILPELLLAPARRTYEIFLVA